MPSARREAPEEAPLLGSHPPAQQEDGQKRRSTLLTICPFILGNELCERLAFYGSARQLGLCLKRADSAAHLAAHAPSPCAVPCTCILVAEQPCRGQQQLHGIPS